VTGPQNDATTGRRVLVGGLSHEELLARLGEAGVLLNAHAETLLAAAVEGASHAGTLVIVERSVRELGLPEGGTLPEVYERALAEGLRLCPPATGAYLRLALLDQASAPDRVLSAGRAPSGSVTVAAPRLRDDPDFPAGLYLRVIDDRPWLRGYRCDDQHEWSPDDRFAFRAAGGSRQDRPTRTTATATAGPATAERAAAAVI
jgi:hypothetical protein